MPKIAGLNSSTNDHAYEVAVRMPPADGERDVSGTGFS